jgi:Golgi apyrase
MEKHTPLFLYATAGMRLLESVKQGRVLAATCRYLKLNSDFRIEDGTLEGPCGNSVRIITGEEEGLFGWIAVNYLMDGFNGSSDDRTTYGFLDMGGASTQIAFEPNKTEKAKAKNLVPVRLRLLGGQEIHHEVFVTTWLGYGTNQARERYVAKAIDEYETHRPASSTTDMTMEHVPDPCLPKNLELTELPIHTGPSPTHNQKSHQIIGTGSFTQCLLATAPLLNKDAPCPDTHCLMNGVHVPAIDFSVAHFIGVSEYWYSSEDAFGLGGAYDVVQYEKEAAKFCGRDWSQIEKENVGALGWNSTATSPPPEVDVHWGKVGTKATLPRLQMQCFKAAWIVNVLHEGLGMPRLIDDHGDPATSGGDKVAAEAAHKGLGKPQLPNKKPATPLFQSVDAVGDVAISWTLGKMVLEASKDVPALNKTAKPLGDPLSEVFDTPEGVIMPIRPPIFDYIEDKIRLPSALSRHSLGFSPVGLFFYASVLVCIYFIVKRAQRSGVLSWRKIKRLGWRGERDYAFSANGFAMEEGHASTMRSGSNNSSSNSRGNGRSFDMTSWSRPGMQRSGSTSLNGSMRGLPSRLTPSGSTFPSDTSTSKDGIASPRSPGYSSSSAYGGGGANLNPQALASSLSSLGSISRSRNGSQANLIPRPMSRAATLPGATVHHED